MSISDTRAAQKYASIAEVAAAETKALLGEAAKAPEYADEARLYAEQSAASATSSQEQASIASSAANEAVSAAQSAADGATTIINNQLTEQQVQFQSFLSSYGLQFIGDYEDGPLTFSARNQYIRYEETYWQVAAATNLPFTTTGTGAASWTNDLPSLTPITDDDALRSSLSQDGGASMVGIGGGGTVQDYIDSSSNIIDASSSRIDSLELNSNFTVVSIKNANDSGDCGPFIRGLISSGVKNICISGVVNVKTYGPTTYTMPFDDGTIDPVRVSAGQDSTLEPENQITIPVYLDLPSGVNVFGTNSTYDKIVFGWDRTTIDINQGVGIVQRVDGWDGTYIASATSVNRMTSKVTGSRFSKFAIENAFYSMISDGVQQFAIWDDIIVRNCAYSPIWQGADRCDVTNLNLISVYAGFSVGGMWLQRNDVDYQGGAYIPPYVEGTPIYSVGWIDSLKVTGLMYQGRGTWGAEYQAIDDLFDKYFWKTESALSRLSSKGPDRVTNSTLTVDNPYKGVAGRATAFACRYNRASSGNLIIMPKILYSPKVPHWINPKKASDWADNILIIQGFYEQVGLYTKNNFSDMSPGGANDYYKLSTNKWNSGVTTLPFTVLDGPGSVSEAVFTRCILTRLCQWGLPNLAPMQYDYVYIADAVNNIAGEFVYRLAVKGNDGTFRILESKYLDRYQYGVPHTWSALNTNPILYWKHIRKNFSYAPILYNGSVSTSNAISAASYRGSIELRAGKVIVKVRIVLPSDLSNYTGGFYIGFRELNNYFPYESTTGAWGVEYPMLKMGTLTMTTAGLAKGNIMRAVRIFASSSTAASQNNFMFRFGQDNTSQQLLWSDLSAGSIFAFEVEYDSDTTTFNFTA